MKKVFVYWSVILSILISGGGVIVYGKLLLKKEEIAAKKIREELPLYNAPKAKKRTQPAFDAMIEDSSRKIEPAKPPMIIEEDVSEPPYGAGAPDTDIVPPALRPEVPELPRLPAIPEFPTSVRKPVKSNIVPRAAESSGPGGTAAPKTSP